MSKCAVYCITNKVNDKKYIGSSVDVADRWGRHKRELRSGVHFNAHLQSAWNKYGEENFIFLIVEYCSREEVVDIEEQYIRAAGTTDREVGYNIDAFTGQNRKVSDETKERISNSLKRHFEDPTNRARMAEQARGYKHSDEFKEARRQTFKENWTNPEFRDDMVQKLKDRNQSDEYRKKLSESKKNTWTNPEYREKMKESMKKAMSTSEYKQKQSESTRAAWAKPGMREKCQATRAVHKAAKSKQNKEI